MEKKVALVMGAGDNLGSAISKCFANDGYTVVAGKTEWRKIKSSKK
jgi:NAD(P)-dependent dehydrogenase (short-subunit alcohol dehydrogenase family)